MAQRHVERFSAAFSGRRSLGNLTQAEAGLKPGLALMALQAAETALYPYSRQTPNENATSSRKNEKKLD
jgi:hypothetical protein